MMIPTTVMQCYERNTRFDQSSSQQGPLAKAISAVGIAQRIGFGIDIERFLRFRGRNQLEALVIKFIDSDDGIGGCGIGVSR
jgi:hypothetical protein